jgi:hypothetical protein
MDLDSVPKGGAKFGRRCSWKAEEVRGDYCKFPPSNESGPHTAARRDETISCPERIVCRKTGEISVDIAGRIQDHAIVIETN